MASTPEVLKVIELVLKELEALWANARSAHNANPEDAFTAGRYEGLTQAIVAIENMVAHGRYNKI